MLASLRPLSIALLFSCLAWLPCRPCFSADPPATAPAAEVKVTDTLAHRQSQLADKYARLEKLMLRLAELDAAQNPRRSALLKQAVGQAKEAHVQLQLETIVKLLGQQEPVYGRVIDNQNDVQVDLKALLELLLKEDRSDRLKGEQARVREYIKEVERRLREQSGVQGRTEGGDDAKRLGAEQAEIAKRTADLARRMQENEETGKPGEGKPTEGKPSEGKPSEGKPSEGKPSEGKPSEGKPNEGKPSEAKPSEGKPSEGKPSEGKPSEGKPSEGKPSEGKPSEGKPSESKPSEAKPSEAKPSEGKPSEGKPSEGKPSEGKPSEGKPSEGKPSEGKPSEGKPSEGKPSEGKPSEGEPSEGEPGQKAQNSPPPTDDGYPPRKRLQAAEERMKKAQQKLEEAKRKEAVEEQEEARAELMKAKAELEEILRQLREEEVERTLAALEGRFRKMLEMQLKVYENTKRLDKIAAKDRETGDYGLDTNKLSVEERKIVIEADKALTLLQEEGSSVAFPETVEQMRQDMEKVAERLVANDLNVRTSRITQGLEEDIIAALSEIIEALQKAQRDLEQKKKQPPPQQAQQQQQDQPLVDKIAELKMIRALQMRVNTRTQRYAKLLEHPDDLHGQATEGDLITSLRELANREESIHRVTRDIVLGKNQ